MCSVLNAQEFKRPKPLAQGVLKTIPTELNPRDMFSFPMPLPDLKATKFEPKMVSNEDTLFGQSRRVILFRDNVWQHEFAFTGLRQARLKVPTSDGRAVEKNIWYLVYRVRNTGQTMTFEQVKQNPEFDHLINDLRRGEKVSDDKIKFMPRFTLEGWVVSNAANVSGDDKYQRVSYRDQIDPAVLAQIQRREDPNQKLLDPHQMSKAKIPVAKNAADPGIWGVALWEGVDPRIDFVSVYVQGLTNAFRLGKKDKGDTKLKTLQLNFYRPGDTVGQQEDQVDFGIPLVDNPAKQAEITRRYNLPGPIIRGYEVNKVARRNILILEADAKVNMEDFRSTLTPTMDQGKLPTEIVDAFANAGVDAANVALTTVSEGNRWTFKQGDTEYVLALEPQFWARDFEGIKFIKSLDHIWIYR